MRKSTEKQQSAVRYCEQWLCIEFDGNIESFNNPILGDIYYPVVLNDTIDKECYEEWCKDAINYPEDRKYEERAFQRIAKLLNMQ